MGNNHFMQGMQSFMSLHQRSVENDFVRHARERAERMERAILDAKPSGLLGDGRLASDADIEAADLHDASGLFLGAHKGRMLFFNGDGPLLTYLRTGGGKGRDILLPNMAHVGNRSLVIADLKDGENAFASADHRSQTLRTPCIFLNPYGMRGVPNTRVNPLQILVDIIASKKEIDTEASEIAQILLPPPLRQGENDWVRKGACRLLALRMEWLARFDPENCTLAGLWKFVNSDAFDLVANFSLMKSCSVESIAQRAAAFEATAQEAPKQFEAYKSDATEALSAFEPGKSFARSTSAHDFNFAKLKHNPHTVYLMVPSEKIGVAAAWISLILNYAIETIAKEQGPVRTTFLLDEFPQIPPAPAIMKALRVYREKGIQLWFFAQGRFSLFERWSKDAVKEFEDQAAVMTLKSIAEPDLIRDVQLWSGNQTILMRGVSHNGGSIETAATNLGETKRTVLQSEDLMGLSQTQQLLRIRTMPRLLVADTVPFYDVVPWAKQLRDVRALHRGLTAIS